MAASPRRKSVAVNVGGVMVGRRSAPDRRAVHDQHRYGRRRLHRESGDGAGPGRCRAGPRHRQYRRSRQRRSEDRRDARTSSASRVPIVGDFHYNGHLLLRKYPDCARALAKYRINPGNVNIGKKHDDNFRTMIEAAIEYDRPVRIGVNWGSLDQALLTRMMDENNPARRAARRAGRHDATRSSSAPSNRPKPPSATGSPQDHIILSAKVSGVQDLITRLSRAGRRMRLSAAPRTDRSRPGRQRASSRPRRRYRSCCRKASATPSAPR